MGTSSNRLKKGINMDVHPAEQQEHTYRGALNVVPISEEGNIYNISNEDGTVALDRITLPSGKKVIGQTVLNNDIILILADEAGNSQVGYIREDSSNLHPTYGIYHPITPYNPNGLDLTEQYPEDNNEFNFTLDYPVDCVARKIIDGSRVLYFTDNNNPFGRINLDSPPEVGEILNQSQLIFDQRVPTVKLDKIIEEVSGNIPPGVYQFIPRYITANGGTTTFGIPSDLIPMVPSVKKDGVDEYSGEYPSYGTTNKNISLTIENVDLNYQELELIVAYYSEGGVFKASSIGKIPITSDTIDYLFTNIEDGEQTSITREELRQVPVSYKKAKAITQKDNTLFLSNLQGEKIDDSYLQQVANNITVSYEIEELAYNGREGTAAISDAPSYDILIIEDEQIRVDFNTPVSEFTFITGDNQNVSIDSDDIKYGSLSQSLAKNGDGASAIINANAATTGDTLTIEGITFTGATPVLNPLEFDSTNATQSLIDLINGDSTLSYFAEEINDAGTLKIKLTWKGLGGENEAITYTVGFTGDLLFTGELVNEALTNASDMIIEGDSSIIFTFAGVGKITPSDIFNSELLITDKGAVSISENPQLTIINDDSISTTASNKGFTDFVDEKIHVEKRGYRRGEVYSLGFMLLFKDGTTSFVYHIPGNDKSETVEGKHYPSVGTYNTGNTTGELGTYLSSNDYPLDQNYPGIPTEPGDDNIAASRNIRHHVMPRLDQEPHFRQVNGNNAVIRTLGLKFELNASFDIPDDLKEKVEEIIFVRERRNSNLNKSIYSQGLINRLIESADHFDNDGFPTGNTVDGIQTSRHLQEIPLFNNLESIEIRTSDDGDIPGASGSTEAGISYRGSFFNSASNIRSDRAFFHTPESILNSPSVNLGSLVQAKMKPVLRLEGDAVTTARQPNKFIFDKGIDYCSDYAYHYMHGNYTSYDISYAYDTINDRSIEGIVNREPGVQRNTPLLPESGKIKPTNTRWTQGGWELKVDSDFINHAGTVFKIDHEVFFEDKAQTCSNTFTTCSGTNRGGYIKRSDNLDLSVNTSTSIGNHLYNAEIENLSQYGQLPQASYIPCGRFKLDSLSYGTVFSGDTFITKFSFNTSGLVCYYPFKRDARKAINKPTKTKPKYYHVTIGEPESEGKADGYDLRACHYFFVESDINTNYRHRPEEEKNQNYFPNEPNPTANLEKFIGYLGNIRAYNDLYSYENTLKEFFTRGSTQTVVTDFENRTIYSEQAFEDSVIDSYRNFLVRNYYDLPAHTGPIWDTFVHANTLYIHTPKSCWRTFAEPAATLQGGNLSEVILGTGTLFARPSHEVLTTNGGYAGSISQYGGVHTQMGYMFPDVLQGKIFLLGAGQGGPQLNDLSLQGIYTFSHSNMKTGIIDNGEVDLKNVVTSFAHLIDNPYNNIGYCGGYDYKLRRAWIVKKGNIDRFTLSYSALMQNWSSYHSYSPNVIIAFDNRVLFIEGEVTSKFWEMNIGDKGMYFDNVFPSEIEMSVPTVENQTFNNQSFHLDIRKDNRKLKDDFFDTIQVYTDRQNSNTLDLVDGNGFAPSKLPGEVFYKFRNDEYRLSIPRDSVVDNDIDIFNLDNIYQPLGGNAVTDAGYPIRPRIKGDYAIFKYVYENELTEGVSKNNDFVLREIRTIFENNIR